MLTPEQEAAYSLDYGVSRADLKPEVQAAYDRLQAISVLKAAFVQGRLAKDEFEARLGQAFGSQTRAELTTVTVDLPVGPSVAPPRAPAQVHGWLTIPRAVTCTACMLVLTAIATVAGALGGFPGTLLLFLAFFVAFVAGVTMISTAWDNRRLRKQSAAGASIRHARPDSSENGFCRRG